MLDQIASQLITGLGEKAENALNLDEGFPSADSQPMKVAAVVMLQHLVNAKLASVGSNIESIDTDGWLGPMTAKAIKDLLAECQVLSEGPTSLKDAISGIVLG